MNHNKERVALKKRSSNKKWAEQVDRMTDEHVMRIYRNLRSKKER